MSPSNFLFTNSPNCSAKPWPHMERTSFAVMKMLAEDIAAGKAANSDCGSRTTSASRLARTSPSRPARWWAGSDVAEIIQYAPSTDKVLKRPLLICPPWINVLHSRPES